MFIIALNYENHNTPLVLRDCLFGKISNQMVNQVVILYVLWRHFVD